ncbi:hypothetical protein BB561_003714 [Smittium simulii]|uniref:Uncharacterized protein n=1 Tax=Smittium simulii TaxID=133385 RepID=A0A2T9YK23_9FUNG|nr:hypothetical protein BB561_003714 [Smittium simulii]
MEQEDHQHVTLLTKLTELDDSNLDIQAGLFSLDRAIVPNSQTEPTNSSTLKPSAQPTHNQPTPNNTTTNTFPQNSTELDPQLDNHFQSTTNKTTIDSKPYTSTRPTPLPQIFASNSSPSLSNTKSYKDPTIPYPSPHTNIPHKHNNPHFSNDNSANKVALTSNIIKITQPFFSPDQVFPDALNITEMAAIQEAELLQKKAKLSTKFLSNIPTQSDILSLNQQPAHSSLLSPKIAPIKDLHNDPSTNSNDSFATTQPSLDVEPIIANSTTLSTLQQLNISSDSSILLDHHSKLPLDNKILKSPRNSISLNPSNSLSFDAHPQNQPSSAFISANNQSLLKNSQIVTPQSNLSSKSKNKLHETHFKQTQDYLKQHFLKFIKDNENKNILQDQFQHKPDDNYQTKSNHLLQKNSHSKSNLIDRTFDQNADIDSKFWENGIQTNLYKPKKDSLSSQHTAALKVFSRISNPTHNSDEESSKEEEQYIYVLNNQNSQPTINPHHLINDIKHRDSLASFHSKSQIQSQPTNNLFNNDIINQDTITQNQPFFNDQQQNLNSHLSNNTSQYPINDPFGYQIYSSNSNLNSDSNIFPNNPHLFSNIKKYSSVTSVTPLNPQNSRKPSHPYPSSNYASSSITSGCGGSTRILPFHRRQSRSNLPLGGNNYNYNYSYQSIGQAYRKSINNKKKSIVNQNLRIDDPSQIDNSTSEYYYKNPAMYGNYDPNFYIDFQENYEAKKRRRYLWLFLIKYSFFLCIMISMAYLYKSTSVPLINVKTVLISNLLATEKELIFELSFKAINHNIQAIRVDKSDLSIFAAPYTLTPQPTPDTLPSSEPQHSAHLLSQQNHSLIKLDDPNHNPFILLASIKTLEEDPLVFKNSFPNTTHATTELRILKPGYFDEIPQETLFFKKKKSVKVYDQSGHEKWKEFYNDSFDLTVRGTITYSLWLTKYVEHICISQRFISNTNSSIAQNITLQTLKYLNTDNSYTRSLHTSDQNSFLFFNREYKIKPIILPDNCRESQFT